MRLLIDTDIFCKLGLGGLLDDAISLLGVRIEECGRLHALPHMLRRGKLPRVYGVEACSQLLPIAERMVAVPDPDSTWLDRLTASNSIDPGEAILFASAAQHSLTIATGDKRALRELRGIDGYADALSGRIIVLEAILLSLCRRLGNKAVRRRLKSLSNVDKVLMVCFSDGNSNPIEALDSYYRNLVVELAPLRLWEPQQGVVA